MAKSKTTEERVDPAEVAALKMDVEQVSARAEEIGSKLDGVQQQVAALSDRFSRLESLLLADREARIAAEKVAEKTAEKPAEDEEQGAVIGHEGLPHWRRRSVTEPPRYEYQYQETQNREEIQYEQDYEQYQYDNHYPPHETQTHHPVQQPMYHPPNNYPPNIYQNQQYNQNPAQIIPIPPNQQPQLQTPQPLNNGTERPAEPPDRGHHNQGVLAMAQSNKNRWSTPNTYSKSTNAGQLRNKPSGVPDNSPSTREIDKSKNKPEVKFTEPGLCKYCGQKWFFGQNMFSCWHELQSLLYASELDRAKLIGIFHEFENWGNYMENLQLVRLTWASEQEALNSGLQFRWCMSLYLVQGLFFLAAPTVTCTPVLSLSNILIDGHLHNQGTLTCPAAVCITELEGTIGDFKDEAATSAPEDHATMQLLLIEVYRHDLGLGVAYTREFNTDTPGRVLLYMPEVPVIIDPECQIVLMSFCEKTRQLGFLLQEGCQDSPDDSSWENASFINKIFPDFYTATLKAWFPEANT